MTRCIVAFVLACSMLFVSGVARPISGSDVGTKAAPDKAEPAKIAKSDNTWTVDDVVLAEEADNVQISPDGKWALWIKRAPDKEKNEFIGHLMLSSLTDTKEVQLTRGVFSSGQPQWSPDGKLIAFLSRRPSAAKSKRDDEDDKDDSKAQIWLINPFGGEPWAITKSPRDVRQFGWTDADTIVYVAQEKMGQFELSLKEKKDDVTNVDDEVNEPPVRLWRVAVNDKEKKSERQTDNADRIQDCAVAPGGRYAVTIHERSLSHTFDHKIKPVVYLYDLQAKTRKQVLAGGKFNIAKIHWQLDGKGFYAVNQRTSHPRFVMAYVEELYHYDVAGDKATPVNLGWERGLADAAEGVAPTPDGFIALLADGVRHAAKRYVRKNDTWESLKLPASNRQAVRVGKDGKSLVYLESSATSPPRWHRAKLDGSSFKDDAVLIDVHAELRKKPMARTETFRWKGALDEEVEGLVSYPHNYQEGDGKKHPLIVQIHGGPHWADFDHWDERWACVRNLLCARGAFVLRPNYHGSSHYGLKWSESIAGRYYLPVEDIEKGIDAFVARGQVDAGKIGLGGWSNGAILTMALITRRQYQAASAGAGGSEWAADWGVCDFGMSFSNYYLGKAPFEDPELYRKNAPFYDFPKVRTPTILFHGDQDFAVPTHHSWYQFRTLRELGKAEVRFLLFPGAKHGLTKLSHRKRKVEEELAWFDKHLFNSYKPANPALKDESPLAQAISIKQAARVGTQFGEMKNGVLVPETVVYKDLRMGRFEVTRAQYRAFDKDYKEEPGTDNFPASGISFEQAKVYCAWLAKTTGQPFRLGTVEEMEPIHESAENPENTLDFWAGYTINPEDRARLEPTIKGLGGKAPLLKEVGSFRSSDAKVGIFDLGGNVAEWADDKGKGKVLGGSADVAVGERQQREPAAEYVGFRVVCEPERKKSEK